MKSLIIILSFALFMFCCTVDKETEEQASNHSVIFKLSANTTTNLTGVGISYDITNGTQVRGVFIKCSEMPWQSSTYQNLPEGAGVGISILVNNGPSYGGTGMLTMQIIVDGIVWKTSTINMTTGATASLGGTL